MANSVVLLVDDNKRILRAFCRQLRIVKVITAGSVDEALEALEALSQCPDVVLTDYLMPPGRTGLELLAEVQRRCPRARRFLMSGTTVPPAADQIAEEILVKGSSKLYDLLGRIDAGALP
jgi:CheY-like chemotaxis protein